jgi:hypothetical protein
MVEVDVQIKSVESSKLAEDVTTDSNVSFNATANLTEGDRAPGVLTLKFTIELSTNPEVAKMVVAGTATIRGNDSEVEDMLKVEGESGTPPVFMKIYQKVYALLYLMSGSLRIPYPSPGLLKTVHLASSKELAVENESRVSQ